MLQPQQRKTIRMSPRGMTPLSHPTLRSTSKASPPWRKVLLDRDRLTQLSVATPGGLKAMEFGCISCQMERLMDSNFLRIGSQQIRMSTGRLSKPMNFRTSRERAGADVVIELCRLPRRQSTVKPTFLTKGGRGINTTLTIHSPIDTPNARN